MAEPHFARFFSDISGIYRSIQRLRARFTKASGVKSVHIFWLYLLREHPEGLTAAELAAAARNTSSLVSREIAELVESGLVCTEGLTARRRYAWKFHLTPQGQRMAEEIDRIALDVQSYVSREVSQEELQSFYRVLAKLCDGFSQLDKQNILSLGAENER